MSLRGHDAIPTFVGNLLGSWGSVGNSFHFCMWHDGVCTEFLGTTLRNGVQQTVLNLPKQPLPDQQWQKSLELEI